MKAASWVKTPKGYVVLLMTVFLVIASIGARSVEGIMNGLIAVGACIAADVACGIYTKRNRKHSLPDSAIITGLIISLILGTANTWYIVAATSVISILSKHVLAYKNKPIFNPAVFGLLMSIWLFGSGQSWWGAFGDLPAWTIAILVLGGYVVVHRVNKFPQVFTFLGVYFILLFIMGICHVQEVPDAFRPPFINASLFFAFFMLTDPPTSPAKIKDQIQYSILAAVVGAIVYGAFGGLSYLFAGLISANLYHFFRSRFAVNRSERRSTG
ncbi:RnfABCDGE type electron transport complex subunit D [Paenibacillus cremeus]|uniref:RnfABCDGE type electron transport complex subunit D n=1 Tax=Paenibacillus cremeus TaxID=2163881 RepID=A0A559K6Y0_9BACL|nr:RnfABCDGE type electron transport complex subunit D [Paenibacillus cremeus]TVY07876.1 RnfABCDGE type electron transport complex subunit D [Paenibacillus cremeus]